MEVLVFGPCDEFEGLECHLVEKPERAPEPAQLYYGDVPKKNRILDRLRRHLRIKSKDGSSVETASTAASSTQSLSVSICTTDGVCGDLPLIQQRLLEMGVSAAEFEFVPDKVSKEVMDLHDSSNEEHLEDENITHIKTGIWQVTKLNDDGEPQTPFYVVTGVTMEDTVDTKKLRKALFSGETNKRRPKLSMAETSIAEKLVGFRSGTMAPICHSTNMKLYLEESIVKDAGPTHRLNVGSGMFGQCLSIDLGSFLKVARANRFGMELVSIKKTKRRQQ